MKVFGTDGVRGVANVALTPELALRIARATAALLADRADPRKPVVVGRDTRVSGPMLEGAIVAGLSSAGRDVVTIGIAPTPAVAAITRHIGAAAGVAISASHNPIEDNGIKIFSAGDKLTDADEERIEALLDRDELPRPSGTAVGRAAHAPELLATYVDGIVAAGRDLRGLTIVMDAAYGAAFQVAPEALRRAGATVLPMNAEPDGERINVQCGATDLTPLSAAVRRFSAEQPQAHVVGVAFDGDADRALFVDERGRTVTGDHILLALARERHARGALPHATVVATVMSNIGLEHALGHEGIALRRTPVGDRYVLDAMRAGGYVLGGEQSGHIVDLAHNTTGDGPLTCVLLLSILAQSGSMLSTLVDELRLYPQVLINVPSRNGRAREQSDEVRDAIQRAERELHGDGRVLVRSSGTEPVIRVMVEGPDDAATHRIARDIARTIESSGQR